MNESSAPGSTTLVDHRSDRVGGFVGPYKLLSVLGEGGFGVVYEAEQTHPIKRRVALKVIKLGMDTREFVMRFESERQTLAELDHPHIAKVLGAGATEDGRPYFVMELVRGEPINEYSNNHLLSVKQRVELFLQVCDAIQYAHECGVVHRDLKPNNLIVATHGGQPFVQVIDFGIAKLTSQRSDAQESLTRVGDIIGTPMFMSPEQLSGLGKIDGRSDVYSLGVVLYQLLTDSTPIPASTFANRALNQLLSHVMETDPPRPSARLHESADTLRRIAQNCGADSGALTRMIKGDLDWVVMQALEKTPERRYASVRDFGLDLRRFLAGQSVLAAPPSLWYRIRKRAAGLRKTVIWPALSLILMAALSVTLWRFKGADSLPADRSVAVLPFRNLSSDPKDAFFATGIHHAVVTQLSRVSDLRVVSRTSFQGLEQPSTNALNVGEQLGVAMVLRGSVSRLGSHVRVNAALSNAHDGTVAWSEQFDVEMTAADLFDVQKQITLVIADRLGASASTSQKASNVHADTQSTEAYAAYLKGKTLARYGNNTLDEIEQALAAFDDAIKADPAFAGAYSSKAVAHMALAWGGRARDEHLAEARRALELAAALAPESVDTYLAQATYYYRGLADYAAAERVLAKALAIEPNNIDVWSLRAAGARRDLRLSDAIVAFKRVVELDPLRVSEAADLAYTLALAGRLEEARQAALDAFAKGPQSPYVLGAATMVELWIGDRDAAWRFAKRQPKLDSGAYDYFRSAYALYDSDPSRLNPLMQRWPEPNQFGYFDLMRVFALRDVGDFQQAEAVLLSLRARVEQQLRVTPSADEERKLLVAVLALSNERELLRAALDDLLADPPRDKLWLVEEGFVIVAALAVSGEHNRSLDLIDSLIGQFGLAQFSRVELSPAFDGLRDDARYQALATRYREWRTQFTNGDG